MAVLQKRKNSASYKLDVERKRIKRAIARLEKSGTSDMKLQYLKGALTSSYVGKNGNPTTAKQILKTVKNVKIPTLSYNPEKEARQTKIAVERLKRQSVAKEGSIESVKNHIFYRATQHIWQNANVLPSQRYQAIEEYFGMNLESVYEKIMRENSQVIKNAMESFKKVSDTNEEGFSNDNGDTSQSSWYATVIAFVKIAYRYAS